MNAIPAKVAGVERIVMVTPPQRDGGISPATLAAAKVAGVDEIYLVGGAQAIAALAYGTESIPRVEKITGPGNAYVAAAKRLVSGEVGIDMIAGPSEVCVLADATAEPVPTEPQGVPNFDDEPQVAIDTEGAVAENHEASAAVFGGAATVPAGPAHEGGLPLVDGAGEDPGATVAMPAMPQE